MLRERERDNPLLRINLAVRCRRAVPAELSDGEPTIFPPRTSSVMTSASCPPSTNRFVVACLTARRSGSKPAALGERVGNCACAGTNNAHARATRNTFVVWPIQTTTSKTVAKKNRQSDTGLRSRGQRVSGSSVNVQTGIRRRIPRRFQKTYDRFALLRRRILCLLQDRDSDVLSGAPCTQHAIEQGHCRLAGYSHTAVVSDGISRTLAFSFG